MTDAKNDLIGRADEATLTSTPVTSAPQPERERGVTTPLDMDALGKAILPATAGLTLAGFIVSVPHFAKAGVPIQAVSYPSFLAAGVLFTLLLACSWAMSMEVLLLFSLRTREAYLYLAFTAISMYVLGSVLGDDYRVSVYVLLCTAFFCLLPKDLTFRSLRDVDSARSNIYSLMRLVAMTSWLLAAFPKMVYPVVYAQFGGGLPQRIAMIDRSNGSGVGAEWVSHLCETGMAGPSKKYPSCRYVYRVHENDSFLWLFVRDKWGKCDEYYRAELPWVAFAVQRNSCLARIANAAVPLITSAP